MLYHQSGLTPSILFYTDAIDKNSYQGSLISSEKDAEHPIHFDSKVYVRNDFTYLPEYISDVKKPGYTLPVAKNMFVSDSFKKVMMRDIKESQLSNVGKYVYSDLNFILLKWMVEAQMHELPISTVQELTPEYVRGLLVKKPSHKKEDERQLVLQFQE